MAVGQPVNRLTVSILPCLHDSPRHARPQAKPPVIARGCHLYTIRHSVKLSIGASAIVSILLQIANCVLEIAGNLQSP